MDDVYYKLAVKPAMKGPRGPRPAGRIFDVGVSGLSDAELLAFFFIGSPNGSSTENASRALERFGSLGQLVNAPIERLLTSRGIGLGRYALILAAVELARRVDDERRRGGAAS